MRNIIRAAARHHSRTTCTQTYLLFSRHIPCPGQQWIFAAKLHRHRRIAHISTRQPDFMRHNRGIMNTIIYIIGAYLIGSISFALVSSKLFGLADPRTYGSGNPGATNVLRTGNKKAALLTLIGDAAKGWIVVWPGIHYAGQWDISGAAVACASVAVFIGHLWPVFSRFQGGKGVATALGILLGVSPFLGLMALVTWLAVAFIWRYSSLAAIVAAVCAPLYYGLLSGFNAQFIAIIIMSLLLLSRHAQNIGNLLKGRESKIGSKKA
jgi:glycerol-3-phosphate acyltransferase PlsY